MYVKLPAEDMLPGESDMVGRLRLSLYGTRDAAQNWMKHYSGKLRNMGFTQGKASTCNFANLDKELYLTCHGDDFFITGPRNGIDWFSGDGEDL